MMQSTTTLTQKMFSEVPLEGHFHFQDQASGRWFQWVKYSETLAQRTTPLGQAYGRWVVFKADAPVQVVA